MPAMMRPAVAPRGIAATSPSSSLRRLMTEMRRNQFRPVPGSPGSTSPSRDSGHGRQHAQRKVRVHAPQVVAHDPLEPQPSDRRALVTGEAGRSARTGSVPCGSLRCRAGPRGGRCRGCAPLFAGVRPDVDEPVGVAHHFQVVLDHEQRVAAPLQVSECIQERDPVAGCRPAEGSSST
jgi:hypothetical protein